MGLNRPSDVQLLSSEHRALADELAEKFTREELLSLVRELPFDEHAANLAIPRHSPIISHSFMMTLFAERKGNAELIAYVAAASHYSAVKCLTVYLEERQQAFDKLERFLTMLKRVKDKDAPLLFAAIKWKSPEGVDPLTKIASAIDLSDNV